MLITGEIYHVFNKTVASEQVFVPKRNFLRALDSVSFYRFPQKLKYSRFKVLSQEAKEEYLKISEGAKPLVEILAYAFMPNHYHFLLQQLSDKGVSTFISNFQNSFAKYINLKEGREGSLFKRPFKSKRITADEELVHVSRYIHLNPVTSYLIEFKDLENYDHTSYSFYLGKKKPGLISIDKILQIFKSPERYEKFIFDQVDYHRKLSQIKHLTLE